MSKYSKRYFTLPLITSTDKIHIFYGFPQIMYSRISHTLHRS